MVGFFHVRDWGVVKQNTKERLLRLPQVTIEGDYIFCKSGDSNDVIRYLLGDLKEGFLEVSSGGPLFAPCIREKEFITYFEDHKAISKHQYEKYVEKYCLLNKGQPSSKEVIRIAKNQPITQKWLKKHLSRGRFYDITDKIKSSEKKLKKHKIDYMKVVYGNGLVAPEVVFKGHCVKWTLENNSVLILESDASCNYNQIKESICLFLEDSY